MEIPGVRKLVLEAPGPLHLNTTDAVREAIAEWRLSLRNETDKSRFLFETSALSEREGLPFFHGPRWDGKERSTWNSIVVAAARDGNHRPAIDPLSEERQRRALLLSSISSLSVRGDLERLYRMKEAGEATTKKGKREGDLYLDSEDLLRWFHHLKSMYPGKAHFSRLYLDTQATPEELAGGQYAESELIYHDENAVNALLDDMNGGDVDAVIVPINKDDRHWYISLFRLERTSRTVFGTVYDPELRLSESQIVSICQTIENRLFEALSLNMMVMSMPSKPPRQRDGYNCGVYVCASALAWLSDSDFSEGSFDVELFRTLVVDTVIDIAELRAARSQ